MVSVHIVTVLQYVHHLCPSTASGKAPRSRREQEHSSPRKASGYAQLRSGLIRVLQESCFCMQHPLQWLLHSHHARSLNGGALLFAGQKVRTARDFWRVLNKTYWAAPGNISQAVSPPPLLCRSEIGLLKSFSIISMPGKASEAAGNRGSQ